MTLSVLRRPLGPVIRWAAALALTVVVTATPAALPTQPGGPAAAPASAAMVVPVVTGQWVHALSAFQPPKYAAGFAHFDYANPAAPKGGTLRLGNPDRRSSFDKFNPYTLKGVAPAAMTMFVFETLAVFSMDEPQAMYGLVAQAFKVEPDLSALRIRVHPQARFSDGSPVTAEDVAHSFRMVSGKQAAPPYQSLYAGVARAVVEDAQTVRFELRERKLDLVWALGSLPVFSRQWGPGLPFDKLVDQLPIASGPYTIDKVEMPRRLELKRNPNHWARDLGVSKGLFNFDRIVYRFYKDQAVRREAFKAGEFDIYKEYGARSWVRQHQGAKWRDGRILKTAFEVGTGSMLQSMQINLRRPKFQDIRVREAIVAAWDFETINRYRSFTRANSMFNNSDFAAQGLPSPAELALLEHFRASLPPAVFGPAFVAPRTDTGPNALRDNLKHARDLLSQAGWNVAADGKLRNALGDAFTIEYLEPNQIGRNTEFQRNLEKLGIGFTERLVDFAIYRKRLESFDFDLVTIVEGKFTLPSAGDLQDSYGSAAADEAGSGNYRGVKSAAVDALIQRIAQASTLDELRAAARALDRVVMWSFFQMPELFSRREQASYWNKFGIPKVQPLHFAIDSYASEHSAPWPLWAWWDKSLAPSQRPLDLPAKP